MNLSNETNTLTEYRIIIGTDVENIDSVKSVLSEIFAGYTYYKGVGGWNPDGAPYAGAEKKNYIEEIAHVFEIVCSPSFDFNVAIKKLAPILDGISEQIMVTSRTVSTHHFSVSNVLKLIEND